MAEIYIAWGYYHHTGNQYRKYHNACKDSPALELITRKTVSGNRARAKLHYRRPYLIKKRIRKRRYRIKALNGIR